MIKKSKPCHTKQKNNNKKARVHFNEWFQKEVN